MAVRSNSNPNKAAAIKPTSYGKKYVPLKLCCSCDDEKEISDFYVSYNVLHSDGHVPFCKECIQNLSYNQETQTLDIDSFKDVLRQINKPYIESVLQSSINEYNRTYEGLPVEPGNRKKIVGLYMKNIATLKQCKKLNWDTGQEFNEKERLRNNGESLLEVESGYLQNSKSTSEDNDIQVKWNKADKRNMNYCISVVGYDPFENCGLTEVDKKFCFNILAGYCDSDGIRSDGHKIQSVIQISLSQLQCRKLDELINIELRKEKPNEKKVKDISTTKKQLLDSIAKIAQDNNLASAYNDNSKAGHNTLSEKMKEMAEAGFESIKVNLFDINTSKAMKQIEDISNQSILEQLSFDENDYVEMIKEQREKLLSFQNKIADLEEKNRILQNEVNDLGNKRKK